MHDSLYVNSFLTYENLFFQHCVPTGKGVKRKPAGPGQKGGCVSLVALQQGHLEQAQSNETQKAVGY